MVDIVERRLFVPRLPPPISGTQYVTLVRVARDFEAMGEDEAVWFRVVNTGGDAAALHKLLYDRSREWNAWGRLVKTVGSKAFDGIVNHLLEESRCSPGARLVDVLPWSRPPAAVAWSETPFEIVCRHYDGRLRLTLERDGCEYWGVDFKSEHERDRFVDWMRWQKPRFEEFARRAINPALLERQLLREMRAAERAAGKIAGAGDAARPLRDWQGPQD